MQAHGVLSLQEAIQHKDQQLNEAYQASLKAEMRAHAQEAAIGALETENHLLSAKNREYQETASYHKAQWEQASAELEVSQQNLRLAKDQIDSREQAIHALNDELLRVAPNTPRKGRRRVFDDDSKENLQEELAEQQKKYDRLQRECGKYQSDLSELDRLRRHSRDIEGQNRFLTEKVGTLTHAIVDLESQISTYVRDLDQLRSQNTKLLATAPSKTPQKPSTPRLRTPIKTPNKMRQRRGSPILMSPLSPLTPKSKSSEITESDLFAFRAFEEQLDAIDETCDEDPQYGDESLHTSMSYIVRHHLDHEEWMRHQETTDSEHSQIDDDAASQPSVEGSIESKASTLDTSELNASFLDRLRQAVNNIF